MNKITALMLVYIILLSGCNSNEQEKDLKLSRFEANDSQLYHPLDTVDVNYDISTKNLTKDEVFGIHIYMVYDDESVSSEEQATIEQTFLLAAVEHKVLLDGVNTYNETITLPLTVAQGGKYTLFALIDPSDEYQEVNEENNTPTELDTETDTNEEYPSAQIEIVQSSEHDFSLENFYFENGAVLLEQPGVDVSNGKSAIAAEILGSLAYKYIGLGESDANVTAQIKIGDEWQALSLWNEETELYESEIPVSQDHINSGIMLGIDINLSDTQREALFSSYDQNSENSLSLKFTVSDDGIDTFDSYLVEQEADNNTLLTSIPYYFIPKEVTTKSNRLSPLNGIRAADTEVAHKDFVNYSKVIGKKSMVAAEIAMDSYANIIAVNDKDRTANIKNNAEIKTWLFNHDIVFLGADFNAKAVRNETLSYKSLDASTTYLNAKIYQVAIPIPTTYVSIPIPIKKWEKHKDLASTVFSVGPIPLKLTVGIQGTISTALSLNNNPDQLTLKAQLPKTELFVYGRGGVTIGVGEAGPQVGGGLLDAEFNVNTTAGFIPNTNDVSVEFDLSPSIKSIYLKLGAYLNLTEVKWCKKWRVPYPCGLKPGKTKNFWFYATKGALFKKQWTVYKKQVTLYGD